VRWVPLVAAVAVLVPAAAAEARPLDLLGAAPPAASRSLDAAAAPASDDDVVASDSLDKPGLRGAPDTNPFALPPMIDLRAAPGSGDARALARSVLGVRRLALSPAARAAIAGGRVDAGALELLLALRRGTAPLLVFKARGRGLRVQETTLATTQGTLTRLTGLPAATAPSALRLRPVAASALDVGGGTVKPARGTEIGARAASMASRYLGIPYVWGGATPAGGFDCSGLMLYVYAELGVPLSHYAAFQFHEGARIPAAELLPGDLVFFHPKADGPGHVGMYIGDAQFIHAPPTRDVVKVSSLSEPSYQRLYMGAVRPYA